MRLIERVYEVGAGLGGRLLPYWPFLPEKVRAGLRGRADLQTRLTRWAESGRGSGPLAWFHAPSVGEGLQLRPVIESVREQRPDLKVFYTYFSPSAEDLAQALPVDHADYLPIDTTAEVTAALEVIRPSVIVFGKTEVWPTLTRVARDRDVALGLVSATVAPNSSRLRPLARALLRDAYGRLDAVGAISEDDAARLVELGVSESRIQVTGDARFDQALARARRVERGQPPVSLVAGHGPTIVAGSTWPEDERRLLPALSSLRRRHPELRVILAPHEPTPDHVANLEHGLALAGFAEARLSRLEGGSVRKWQAVVVDRVGVLADLYAAGDMAYVGGGFGRRGLHSVLEPAAVGIPVSFGPRHANAREAAALIEQGGAIVATDAEALEGTLDRWLRDPGLRGRAGAAARNYVEENQGADRRNAELVLSLLNGG